MNNLALINLDANGSGLAVGTIFFAECYASGVYLKDFGVKNDDVVICKIIEKKEGEYPFLERIKLHIWKNKDDDHLVIGAETSADDEGWIVYAGDLDGSGFLPKDEAVRQKALSIIGGSWLKNESLSLR